MDLKVTMKKPTTPNEKPVPKSKTEQPAATAASEAKATKASPTPKTPSKPKAITAKTSKKAEVVAPNPVAETAEISPFERVGLTAGSIWHYLSENGASPVAKLVKALPEEEKIIQRSIGWLAQEGKIVFDTIDRTETIGLTE
jgi:predicted DNA-binding transcriptional regulator AlpA